MKEESIRLRVHDKEELAQYSKGTTDIEFLFSFGWGELMGIANRTDFDLTSHNKLANEKLRYFDQEKQEWIIPYVIEPSIGVDRLLLAIIVDSYQEEQINDESRIVMQLKYELCPYKVCVLPLVKKHSESAKEIFDMLIDHDIIATYDEVGSIGKRYRRQDSIGTYWCITYDYDSINDHSVTIRHRDTMKQDRIKIEDIISYIQNNK